MSKKLVFMFFRTRLDKEREREKEIDEEVPLNETIPQKDNTPERQGTVHPEKKIVHRVSTTNR